MSKGKKWLTAWDMRKSHLWGTPTKMYMRRSAFGVTSACGVTIILRGWEEDATHQIRAPKPRCKKCSSIEK